jgi:hypothetical protein
MQTKSYANGRRLFRPLSDLHVEFRAPGYRLPVLEGTPEKDVVCLLAGDIGTGWTHRDFVADLCARHRAVLYTPGNHEYYCSHRIQKVDRKWQELSEELGNLSFLNPGMVRVDGLLVLGAALWTDLDKLSPMAEWAARQYMNDYRQITYEDAGVFRKMRPADTVRINKQHVDFIRRNAEPGCLVMTHHAPTFAVKVFPGSQPTDYAYYNTCLDDFLASDEAPGTWVFGHTHQSTTHEVGNTVCVSNAAGYEGHELVRGFNPNLVLSL